MFRINFFYSSPFKCRTVRKLTRILSRKDLVKVSNVVYRWRVISQSCVGVSCRVWNRDGRACPRGTCLWILKGEVNSDNGVVYPEVSLLETRNLLSVLNQGLHLHTSRRTILYHTKVDNFFVFVTVSVDTSPIYRNLLYTNPKRKRQRKLVEVTRDDWKVSHGTSIN